VAELAGHIGAAARKHSLAEGLRLIELGLKSGAFGGKGAVGDWAERHGAEVKLTVI
jgi:hypothetical protein